MKGALKILAVVVLVAGAGAGGYLLGGGKKAADGSQHPVSAAVDDKPKAAVAADAPAGSAGKDDAKAGAPRRIEPVRPVNWPAFSIELATFRDSADAMDYAAEMRRRQLAVEVVETVDEGGRSWFHVRWGRFVDPRQAAARLGEVQKTAGIYGIVTAELPAHPATVPGAAPTASP